MDRIKGEVEGQVKRKGQDSLKKKHHSREGRPAFYFTFSV